MSAPSIRRVPSAKRTLIAILASVAMLGGFVVSAAPASALTTTDMANNLFKTLNQMRAVHNIPPLTLHTKLITSASAHNSLQLKNQQVSKQFPGEPNLVTRMAKAGFPAGTAVESVGTSAYGYQNLLNLQQAIYRAQDGHRNILNPNVRYVGIGLIVDKAHNHMWLTEDFASPHAATPSATTLSQTIANAVLTVMNTERALNGRPALRMNSQLIQSAHLHNLDMAKWNEMSHQLPDEPFFATRISNAGYNWQTAGENVGWNSVQTQQGALDLQTIMYNEVPPDDGHRQNILSSTFRDVGIDIYFDSAHGKMWLTQDFGSPA